VGICSFKTVLTSNLDPFLCIAIRSVPKRQYSCAKINNTPTIQPINQFLIVFIRFIYARFRNTRPVPVDAVEVFVVVLRTAPVVAPLRVEPAVPFLAVPFLDVAPFLITVPELASLDSLLAIDLRPVRVAGREAGPREAVLPGACLFLVAAVLPVVLELVVEVVVNFREAPAREALAFSTMLESIFEAVVVREDVEFFNGEAGRAILDFVGDAGRDWFAIRELDEVGDKICPGRT
jgi:hypothetical protein